MDISVEHHEVAQKRPAFNLAVLKMVKGFFARMLIGILGLGGEDE